MADLKISELTNLTAADPANDMIPIVDVSATPPASGSTKRISINNILACSPTATLASATITGDLTVDTSTLKVDSANNRVGIGTATPAAVLHVASGNVRLSDSAQVEFGGTTNSISGSNASNLIEIYTNNLRRHRIDSNGVATWSNVGGVAGDAMTLNSTGLGVGGGPDTGLLTVGATTITSATTASIRVLSNKATFVVTADGATNMAGTTINYSWANGTQGPLIFRNASISNVMTLDASGNVGIGVTPSATNSTYFQALEIARVGQGLTAAKNVLTGSPSSWLSNNSYATYSSGVVWNYAISQPAAQYRLFEGQHQWYTAPSGTAGNAITFTERLRLKETGQLRFVPLASDPSGAEAGDVYYNSTSNKLKCYNGTTWNDLF